MSRLKLIVVSIAVVSALSAVTASSASAFSWWIEKEKGGEEVLKEKIKELFNKESVVHAPFKFRWIAKEVSCAGASYEEGFIEGPLGLGAQSIKLEKCSVTKPAGCGIAKSEIKTGELTGKIKLNGTAVEFELKSKAGAFAKFELTGACEGTVEVTGTASGEITNPAELSKEKSFLFHNKKEGGLMIEKKPVEANEGETGYSATKGWSAH